MALPPVVVGLLVYLFLSRNGPLAAMGLLFTPHAMVLAQLILALPFVVGITMAAVAAEEKRCQDRLWYLFYERNDLDVWLATSKDMKVWTNLQDEPVMTPGPGEYDKDMIALNQIIKHKGRYYAYYHGSAKTGPKAKLWSTCVAGSTDLIHWEKYAGNPLQPVEQNKSSGIVVHDGEKFRLYTMYSQVHVHVPVP